MLLALAAAVQAVGPHRTLPTKNLVQRSCCIWFVHPLTSTCSFSLQSGKDKNAIDKVFKNLDENGDSQVDFKEFVLFVAALTCCCHKYFEQNAAK